MNALQQFENIFGIKLTRSKHTEILLMLIFVELVVAFSYIGYIQVPPISVTTMHIMVIVAGMLFGPSDAVAVALVFAGTSMWKASVTSVEYGDIAFSPFLSGKPVPSLIMAVGARVLFALFAGYVFRWFFSKERKHRYLGISLISVLSALAHSLFAYIPMVTFFGAAKVKTPDSFGKTLILNNLLLFAVTIIVVVLCYRFFELTVIRSFLVNASMEDMEKKENRNRTLIILFAVLLVCSVFIAMHFMTRFRMFIETSGENISPSYVSWTYALVLQFIAGFVGIFGVLTIVIKWIQEYYAYLTLEANIQARENAEIANKTKSAFLFNMSHDIRTPMNAILGYTNIALSHKDDQDRVEDSLNKIKTSGGHLLNLINDILEMSRIEAGRLEINEEPIDIRDVINNVSDMCRSLTVSKDIDFSVEFGEIRTPYIYADELHSNEVLINLISNAVKYTGQGGKIHYTVEQLEDTGDGKAQFRFVIRDNGIGMSEEFQKHIFEAFARESTSSVSKQEGAGLGLSIVKQLVDMAGGTISVSSKSGEGSVFTLEVPFRVMDEQAIEEFLKGKDRSEAPVPEKSLEGKRVLLVEDNEMNREIATEILEDQGLAVETAEDGKVAITMVNGKGIGYYDFILMDIQMPVLDGYSATAAIRKLPYGDRVPIIALSANAFKEDVEKSLAMGMNAHVAKPIDIKTLMDTMRSLAK